MSTLLHAKRSLERRLHSRIHFERGPFRAEPRDASRDEHPLIVVVDSPFRGDPRYLATGEDQLHAVERSIEIVDAMTADEGPS